MITDDGGASAPVCGAETRGKAPQSAERFFAVADPYDFGESLRFLPFGGYDPTCRLDGRSLWKAARTPEGPATLHLQRSPGGVRATAWGEGASWVLDRVGPLLGSTDDPDAFAPEAPAVGSLARRHRGLRLPRSPWVLDGLAAYILQQRVTFRDATRAHRRLVALLSSPAPGPTDLRLPLAAAEWARLGPDQLFRAGIDGQRARALRAAGHETRRIEHVFTLDHARARATLASIPGCGPWTVEIALGFVLGDPDAVPTGDLHLPHEIAWTLAGEPHGDDRRMLELLEPFRGQRFRLIRLLIADGRVRLGHGARRDRR